jgi:hypothetical protein
MTINRVVNSTYARLETTEIREYFGMTIRVFIEAVGSHLSG